MSCKKQMQILMIHYLTGLLAFFCFSSKMYQIHFLQYAKILANTSKIKKFAKIKVCCMQQSNSFLQLAKRLKIALGPILQIVIEYSLEQVACGIRELHAMPIMLAIYRR
jgi:hypothetical protein